MIEERLLRAVLFMESHLGEELSVEQLAQVSHISAYHFHRLFRLWSGQPVIEYLRRIRLEHAAYRLRATQLTIKEIATAVGYDSADAFGRAFKSSLGQSPTAYRTMWSSLRASHEGHQAAPVAHRPGVRQSTQAGEVTIQYQRAWRMICLRHIGSYHEVHRAWAILDAAVVKLGADLARAPRFGISHDDPELVATDRIRYDACYGVSSPRLEPLDLNGMPGFHWRDMPDANYALTTHRGPYHLLGDAYRRLFIDWLPGSGWLPGNAPVLERYMNSPRAVDEKDLRTVLMLPLKHRVGRPPLL